ncbi:MAG: hypothetical protein WDN28_01980 [Chthoniobacter sp.]
MLRILLNADPLDVLADYAAPKGTPVALTPLGELFLPLEGLIDVGAERTRAPGQGTHQGRARARQGARQAGGLEFHQQRSPPKCSTSTASARATGRRSNRSS